jgi:hypothetical protein
LDNLHPSAPWKPLAQHKYIGSLQDKEETPVKYLDYASKHTMPQRGFRPGAREEFAQLLRDTTLDSNDVQGIRKVSISCETKSPVHLYSPMFILLAFS